MKLYLAMSCLQNEPQEHVFRELLKLGPDGIQLTPGCKPTAGFEDFVLGELQENRVKVRPHHSFVWEHQNSAIWHDGELSGGGFVNACLGSVHPPLLKHAGTKTFEEWLRYVRELGGAYETMYDGYFLSNGKELEAAMEARLPLAVDVSHLNMQLWRGTLARCTAEQVLDYGNVREIHISANDGRSDSHKPLLPDSYGLDWARERGNGGVPVVLECYMHKLTLAERQRQVEVARG